MIIKLLGFLFKKVIADLPEEKKRELWVKFSILMTEVVKAAAEGAAEGAMNSNNKGGLYESNH